MTTVAFLGLGVMGYPMAGYLARSGLDVRVYNRTFAKATKWVDEYQGTACQTPAEAATGCDVVFACVGNDDDVRAITVREDGAFHGMSRGSFFVDHTTASATVARELHEAGAALGIGFLDAPVSGGQAGAENGALTVMAGGDEAAFEVVKPMIDHFSRSVRLMGGSGAGQLTKMVNQVCIAGILQGLSEGLHLAEKAGLDGNAVIDVISKGAAQSWQMENRYSTMLDRSFDFGFAVDWMRKDLSIALDEARRNGASLPLTAMVDQYYADVQAMGGQRWDTSSLIARLPKD